MRKLPLYIEAGLGELEATVTYIATEFEKNLRAETPVSCKEGCAHCCHYPVLITLGEGIHLYRYLASKGRMSATFRRKLEAHGASTLFQDPAVWLLSNIPCPLLDDKQRCVGYQARPLSCRLTYSSGDPADCQVHVFAADSMVDRGDTMRAAAAFEHKLLLRHKISTIRMPISKAILLGEKVVSGELSAENIELALYEEL